MKPRSAGPAAKRALSNGNPDMSDDGAPGSPAPPTIGEIFGLPPNFLIDAHGRIVFRVLRECGGIAIRR